jgi:hypothetical protein
MLEEDYFDIQQGRYEYSNTKKHRLKKDATHVYQSPIHICILSLAKEQKDIRYQREKDYGDFSLQTSCRRCLRVDELFRLNGG